MGKKIIGIAMIGIGILLSACSVTKIKDEKLRDLEFTVVAEDEVPEELLAQLQEEQKEPMKLTYADQGYLYIAESYGAQETSGYSIEMKALYETEDAIHIETELLGPDKAEEIVEEETCPFIVVKTEYSDKYVIFD